MSRSKTVIRMAIMSAGEEMRSHTVGSEAYNKGLLFIDELRNEYKSVDEDDTQVIEDVINAPRMGRPSKTWYENHTPKSVLRGIIGSLVKNGGVDALTIEQKAIVLDIMTKGE